MRILAIDPGTHTSGMVLLRYPDHLDDDGYDSRGLLKAPPDNPEIEVSWKECANLEALHISGSPRTGHSLLVIEGMTYQGRKGVGKEVFETCIWIGRFYQRFYDRPLAHYKPKIITRREVLIHTCGTTRADDKAVRRALLERYDDVEKRGPLKGMASHAWPALALGLTAYDAGSETWDIHRPGLEANPWS